MNLKNFLSNMCAISAILLTGVANIHIYGAEQKVGDFVIVTDGVEKKDYEFKDGVLEILSDKNMTIKNFNLSAPTTNRIVLGKSIDANITLAGVNIDVSETENEAALKIEDNSEGNVTITLAIGTYNTLKSGQGCAGLQKNGGIKKIGKLEIKGSGFVTVTGGAGGAGIGGGAYKEGKNITISEGTVITKGGAEGAGIGGGSNSEGNEIAISGGNVTAIGGAGGAGIGGGSSGKGSEIAISGGNVTATGGSGEEGGAGIGGGAKDEGKNITITGGNVTATGGKEGAGIGGGAYKAGSNVKISGGKVIATGGEYGAGIGGGFSGSGETIAISGGSVTATRGEYGAGAGIGGGAEGESSEFSAKGNAFIVASLIGDETYETSELTSGIIIIENEGKLYGSPQFSQDITIDSGMTLTISDSESFEMEEGKTASAFT